MRGFFDAHNSTYTPPHRILVRFIARRKYSCEPLVVLTRLALILSRNEGNRYNHILFSTISTLLLV